MNKDNCKYDNELLRKIIYRQELLILIIKLILITSVTLVVLFYLPISYFIKVETLKEMGPLNVLINIIVILCNGATGFFFLIFGWEWAWNKFDEATK